jgi:prepilin-type processing-associated H-X9-DG protein
MLLPAIAKARDAAKGLVCKNNLKQCGVAFSLYASDSKDVVALNTNKGSGTFRWWFAYLRGTAQSAAGIPEATTDYLKNYNVGVCPSEAPYRYDKSKPAQCYGTRAGLDAAEPGNYCDSGYSFGTVFVNMNKLSSPSKYYFLADSYRASDAAQLYTIQNYSAGNTALGNAHTRHGVAANLLFADGHVQSLVASELRALGFNGGYNHLKILVPF